jgi:hypothetical protein
MLKETAKSRNDIYSNSHKTMDELNKSLDTSKTPPQAYLNYIHNDLVQQKKIKVS